MEKYRQEIDEEELIKRAQAGNEEAFEKIIEAYKAYVFAIILNFTQDRAEVENIGQEVFLHIYRSLDSYREDNFKGWLSRLTANKTIDYLRHKETSFKERPMDQSQELAEIRSRDQVKTPEELVLNRERQEAFRKLVQDIPATYRQVIEMFYMEDRSYKEIARELDLNEKTVASRIYRGKKLLREKWRDDYAALR